MPKLTWDKAGERLYETGVSKVVLYPHDGGRCEGVAWNGVTAITESPSGAEATPLYADNIKYLNLISAEEFGGTIEAYMYPDEFKACNGESNVSSGVTFGQQPRKTFDLCYVTKVGNDVDGNDHGYKIHLVYNCLAAPSERAYATINDSPEAITFSWEFTTTPIEIEGHRPTAHIVIDTSKLNMDRNEGQLYDLEQILYGTDFELDPDDYGGATGYPIMPRPEYVINLFLNEKG